MLFLDAVSDKPSGHFFCEAVHVLTKRGFFRLMQIMIFWRRSAAAAPKLILGRRVGDLDEPMVGDSDAVRIAAQVAQNLLGPGKGLLAVDHPIGLPEWSKVGRKQALLRQVGEIGEELQAPVLVGGKKLPQEHSPEQACEDTLGYGEARP